MELASRMRWIAMIALSIIAFLLVGWGAISIARNVLGINDAARNQLRQEEIRVEAEKKYNIIAATQARFLVSGPIVAEQEHYEYEIFVNENVVTMKTYVGYDKEEVNSRSFKNTQSAYDTFLAALQRMDVTALRENTKEDDSEQGVCPSGRRYVMNVDDLRRWSASCSRRVGNAGFRMNDVRELFEDQIPRNDFRDLRREIDM